ncbi:MAG: hypothetical protein WD398_12095 [Cyclobacteriaceae bacterium]
MKQFISRNIIKGPPLTSILFIYSPLIIGISFFFAEPMFKGQISQIPIVAYFFPFPFLLFLLLWMDTTHDELMTKIDFNPNLKTKRFKKIMTLSIWTLIVLSIQTLFMKPIMSLNIKELPIWILVPFIAIYALEMGLMVISFYAYNPASHFVGKLVAVVDTQRPFDKHDIEHKQYTTVGHLFPFRYKHTKTIERNI